MNYLTGETSISVDDRRDTSETAREPPRIHEKEQYDSLLNDGDSESLDLGVVRQQSQRRLLRSSLFHLALALVFFVAITLIAILSTDVSRLEIVLAQMRGSLDHLESIQAPATVAGSTTPPPSSSSSSSPTGDELGHCGRSVSEARSLGCVFDPMSWAWQRPECYHGALVSDFLARMDWRFFSTNESRPEDEVPREEWLRGDHPRLWGPRSWHVFHCSYSWRKFHEAFRAKMPMDNDILQFEHTLHCDSTFLHGLDPKIVAPCDSWPGGCTTTEVNAGFNKCGWY